MPNNLESGVAAHYGREGLIEVIMEGLRASGAAMEDLTPEDLAPVDEFHTAGRITTLKAFEMMPVAPGMHILDAGSGIGGTARCLARDYGCRVTGIDITPEYVDAARRLTELMRLAGSCAFHLGSVVDMPFEDGHFDAAISFHVAMNIEDRAAFYDELARVLPSGAPLCIFDVMKGPAGGMRYPVPWSETADTSFLKSRDETCDFIERAGFDIVADESLRDFAIDYFRAVFADIEAAGGPPPLGLHLLTGANSPEKFSNYLAACEAHQIEPVIVVASRR